MVMMAHHTGNRCSFVRFFENLNSISYRGSSAPGAWREAYTANTWEEVSQTRREEREGDGEMREMNILYPACLSSVYGLVIGVNLRGEQ